MDRNLVIQYTIVGIILLAVAVWLTVKFIRKGKRRGSGACAGCALSAHCSKPTPDPSSKDCHTPRK